MRFDQKITQNKCSPWLLFHCLKVKLAEWARALRYLSDHQRFDPYCLHLCCYISILKNVRVRVLLPANFKENDKNLHCGDASILDKFSGCGYYSRASFFGASRVD